jgi:hypothetical protein
MAEAEDERFAVPANISCGIFMKIKSGPSFAVLATSSLRGSARMERNRKVCYTSQSDQEPGQCSYQEMMG